MEQPVPKTRIVLNLVVFQKLALLEDFENCLLLIGASINPAIEQLVLHSFQCCKTSRVVQEQAAMEMEIIILIIKLKEQTHK